MRSFPSITQEVRAIKTSISYARKSGRENYGSENFSLTIESDVPPEVSQDREKLGRFIESVFEEVKARVTDQVVAAGEREPAPERPAPEPSDVGSRRAPPPRGVVRQLRRPSPTGNGHAGGNGRATPTGETASLKQVSYLRSLARDAGYSSDQLSLFVEEVVGRSCALNGLQKREASMVIESLKANAA